ncbi:hypothetical protein [Nitratifractor sp.]
MAKERRILALNTDPGQLDALIEKCAQLSQKYSAGVTLLYVREERLFDLPIFDKAAGGSMEELHEQLLEHLRTRGCEEWAVLAYDNDPVDRAKLEAEREGSFLLVSDEHEDLDELVEKIPIHLLILKKGLSHCYERVFLALDSASSTEEGLDTVLDFVGKADVSCYMDYQLIVSLSDPTLDPVVGAMTSDVLMAEESEVIDIRRNAFEQLCKAKGLRGRFELGEHGLVDDILERSREAEPDLLALVAEDPDTLMAEAAKEIAWRSKEDFLLVYNRSVEK